MNKEELINNSTKNDFMTFLQQDREGKVLKLLDDEGLDILEASPRKEERIRYILEFSNYKNELLQNINFLNILLNTSINNYYASLKKLDNKTYDFILKKCLELNIDSNVIAQLFSYFNLDYKLQALDKFNFSEELLYEILKKDEKEVIQKIIDNNDIDLTKHNINLKIFFKNAKESVFKAIETRNKTGKSLLEINVPIRMLTKSLAEKLWNTYDIFELREVINDAEYCTNMEKINNYIKQKEDNIINNYNNKTLLYPYDEIYESYKNMIIAKENNNDNYYEYRTKYIHSINKTNIEDMDKNITNIYNKYGIEKALEYIKELSNREISNYIIDYNFEENYHNIMIDLRELLRFYYDGNVIIPNEHIELYEKIANIDYLSIEEKQELHKYIKNINMKEIFYDDMSIARYVVNEAIKEYSLTSASLEQYKDEELSKEYGVDIYKINDEPFFGIVKTGNHIKDILPTGHSFSLIGNNCLSVFGNVKKSETFLYDAEDINPDQIVHAFPFDSYTFYRPFEYSFNATDRVHTLMMPDELTRLNKNSYNEILILEKGKTATGIDEKIPELKRIALYCIDEIRKQDVEKAKDTGLGIILVNSKHYMQDNNYYKNKFKSINNLYGYEYFNGSYEKDKFENTR